MAMIARYRAGIGAIEGLHVHGNPHLSIVAFGAAEFDIFEVAEEMTGQGWVPGLTQRPRGIHRMMSLLHEESLPVYLDDLRNATTIIRARQGATKSKLTATY